MLPFFLRNKPKIGIEFRSGRNRSRNLKFITQFPTEGSEAGKIHAPLKNLAKIRKFAPAQNLDGKSISDRDLSGPIKSDFYRFFVINQNGN